MLKDNARPDNVPSSLNLVRIFNPSLKGIIEANSWKNMSQLCQLREINHVI